MVHPGPPSLEGAQNALADAQAARADAIARRAQGQADLAATRQEISALGLEQVALAHELEVARHRVRVVTVRAYTGGAGARELDVLMDATRHRRAPLPQRADDRERGGHGAGDRGVPGAAGPGRRPRHRAGRAGRRPPGRHRAGRGRHRPGRPRTIRRAEVELSAAEAMDGASRSDPGEGAWSRLRFCESGGVYTTNTGNGFYGAYQFDLRTWQTMGGTGRPVRRPVLGTGHAGQGPLPGSGRPALAHLRAVRGLGPETARTMPLSPLNLML